MYMFTVLLHFFGGGGEGDKIRPGGCGPVSGPPWARIRAPRTDLLRNAMVKSKMHGFRPISGSRYSRLGGQIIGALKSGSRYQWPLALKIYHQR